MSKIKLNKKVVSILDAYRKEGLTDEQIIESVMKSRNSAEGLLNYVSFEDVMAALVNGYEEEEAPEKAVARYYEKAKQNAWEAEESDDNYELHAESARKEAVEFVLAKFGIKIDGVNK